MKPRIAIAYLALAALVGAILPAGAAAAPPITRAPIDPKIAAMVAAVSASGVRAYDTKLVGFGTRNDFSNRLHSKTRGVFAARDWIASQFEADAKRSHGRMTVSFDTYEQPKISRTPRAVKESSVIAVLRGDDAGAATYVMSSHYDDCNGDCTDGIRNAPGADDNGSGTSAVLEAAKVMAATRFHGTIVFACFDGEELGLWGSNHFAREMRAKGVHVAADLNNDIVGTSLEPDGGRDPYRVRVFSEALPYNAKIPFVNLIGSENDSPSRELARFVKETAQQYVPPMKATLVYRADRFLRGGDQESFQAQGFPAVRFTEAHETFAHQHQNVRVQNGVQYGDLLKYIDFNYLARVTKMNVAALAALALGPEQPGDAQMVMKHLGYDTTLRWKPVARAVSYEVVWRATTAPMWQYSENVGDVTQATVKVNKDDYILGVRAVDAKGRRSPVAYPLPVRG
ncbi:MAG: M20/M25/M40 family metallo-hydrolase [Vulcanimicrobiaceae bacterium]